MTSDQFAPDGGNASMQSRVLEALMRDAQALAHRADAILAPISADRLRLRELLMDDGQIIDIAPQPDRQPSVAAVDGGSVTERMYAADMLVAAAVSAEGMGTQSGLPLGHSTWTHIEPHSGDLERLTGAAMVAQELRVLSALRHDLRIFDGSHGTPVIGLSSALFSRNPAVRVKAMELYSEWEVPDALRELADPSHGEIVALPKADASKSYAHAYAEKYGVEIATGDRFLAAQILNPGEMLAPRAASEFSRLGFSGASSDEDAERMAKALDWGLEPLIKGVRDGDVKVTYVKPQSADTVVKVEFRDTGSGTAERLCRAISDETPGPHLQEPFAQHMADLAAKTVSAGSKAVNASMLASLPPSAGAYLPYLARSYRT